ncbi:MAG: carboxypeptidase regulatory-like domain-containing protein [Bryobacteraceae bacterium]
MARHRPRGVHPLGRLAVSFLIPALFAPALSAQAPPVKKRPASPPSKPEELCSLEGQVLHAATGEPIRKAIVMLQKQEGGQQPAAVTTADGGAFAIRDVPPGRYRLSAERNGFVRQDYSRSSAARSRPSVLELSPGQRLTGLAIRLTPQAVITGRITDEDGEPLADVMVQALRHRYVQGRKQLASAGQSQTNDLGIYRIHGLAPGKYYVGAMRHQMSMRGAVASDPSGAEFGYVPTYYPAATDPAGAAQLDATAGNELRGVDLAMLRARMTRVRGRLTGIPNGPPGRAMLQLLPRGGAASPGFTRNSSTVRDAAGNFEFRGVLPGSYILSGEFWDGRKRRASRQAIDVGPTGLDGVTLAVSDAAPLPGRVRVDGATEAVPLKGVSVYLQAREISFMGGASARVKDDGALVLDNLLADVYTVGVNGLPAGYYLKSVRHGQNDVLENGADLTAGVAGSLDVVVSPAGAQIEGAVINAKQEPAPGCQLVLIPDSRKGPRTQFIKTVTADQNGRYLIQGVAPGDYALYAFEDIENDAWLDPGFLKPFESQAEKLTLKENARESKPLKQIPAQ